MDAILTSIAVVALAEIGDKTQIATIAVGAQFGDVLLVTIGTTLGVMLAELPAVQFGQKIIERVKMIERVSLTTVRIITALLFLVIGLWVITQAAGMLGGQAAHSMSRGAG